MHHRLLLSPNARSGYRQVLDACCGGYRLRCRASAGIKGSPLLGGSEAGATKRCCRVILNSALIRARSTGFVVYFGGKLLLAA